MAVGEQIAGSASFSGGHRHTDLRPVRERPLDGEPLVAIDKLDFTITARQAMPPEGGQREGAARRPTLILEGSRGLDVGLLVMGAGWRR